MPYGDAEIREWLKWLIKIRWIGCLIVSPATFIVRDAGNLTFPLLPVYLTIGFVVSYNGWCHFKLRTSSVNLRENVINQILLDYLALSVVVYFTGGYNSPFLYFFVFHIGVSGVLLPGKWAFKTAGIAILMTGVVMGSLYLGIVPRLSIFKNDSFIHSNVFVMAAYGGIFASTLLFAAYFITYLSGHLHAKQTELKRIYVLTEKLRSSICLEEVMSVLMDSIRSLESISRLKYFSVDKSRFSLVHCENKDDRSKTPAEVVIPLSGPNVFTETFLSCVACMIYPSAETSDYEKEIFSSLFQHSRKAVLLPVWSSFKKKCNVYFNCAYSDCPAFDSEDTRCWTIPSTVCKGEKITDMQEKLRKCINCELFFPVGLLVCDISEMSKPENTIDFEVLIGILDAASLAISNAQVYERTLERSELLYKTIMSNSMDGFWVVDMEGRFLDVNEAYCNLIGYSREELLSMVIPDVEALERPEDTARHLRKIVEIGSDRFETYHRCKDGRIVNIEVSANYINIAGGMIFIFLHDVTERKHAEEALQQSQEKYRLIVDTANEGIWVQDEDYRTIFVNAQMAEMLGYEAEEMIGRKIESFIFEVDLPDHAMKMEKRRQGLAEHYERRWRRKDDEAVWTLVSATPILDAGHHFHGSFAMILDITERKKMEEQFRQSHKMEAVGVLAGGVAHDFNNILTVIKGFGTMAQRRLKDDATAQEFIQEILGGANRAADLTHRLLAFSRKQVISPVLIDLNYITGNMEKMLSRIMGEDIELKTFMDPGELEVMVDSGQIEQVLMNLAANARDAMPDGGSLIIETAAVNIDDSCAENHLFENRGAYAVLTVSDTGIGMDRKTKENIFDPFFTTKEVGKGTGLGLAMVYGIIKQHGGYINVWSEEGKGTTFRIYLPMVNTTAEDVPKSANRESVNYQSAAGRGEKILVAEDESQAMKMIRMVLEEFGYRVIEAGNGAEAVKRFHEDGDSIDLLLLDVIMPVKNGREVYEEIRKLKPDMKAIFTSGYADEMISKQGILEEGFEFISKPIATDLLLAKIREVLDR